MKNNWVVLTGISLICAGCVNSSAPKESMVRSASVVRVPRENQEIVRSVCAGLEASGAVRRGGLYLRDIEGETYLFRYLESHLAEASEWEKELAEWVEPLPEATRKGILFEPMECIFYERGVAGKAPRTEVERIAMQTGLKPEKEAHYRLLHDNPWPDVVAAISKADYRHFSIFLEEIGGNLYLFGWLEYVGSDMEADNAENKKDPTSIRWWKETDACQIAPEGSDAIWAGMDELLFSE